MCKEKRGESVVFEEQHLSCFGRQHESTHMNIHTPTHVYTYMSTIEPYSS